MYIRIRHGMEYSSKDWSIDDISVKYNSTIHRKLFLTYWSQFYGRKIFIFVTCSINVIRMWYRNYIVWYHIRISLHKFLNFASKLNLSPWFYDRLIGQTVAKITPLFGLQIFYYINIFPGILKDHWLVFDFLPQYFIVFIIFTSLYFFFHHSNAHISLCLILIVWISGQFPHFLLSN